MILIGVVASSMTMLYGTIVTAREKTKINSAISMCGGVLSVFLNIVLLPRLGIVAACIASAVSLCFMLIASVHFSKVNVSHKKIIEALLVVVIGVFVNVYCYTISSIAESILMKCFVYVIILFLVASIIGLPVRNLKKIVVSLFKTNS